MPQGYVLGLIGVLIFSLTLPATRYAVQYFDPVFMVLGRAVIGGGLAAALLMLQKKALLPREHKLNIFLVSLSVVIAFPYFISLALRHVPASHAAVVLGLLPLATAVAGVIIAKERHGLRFWGSAIFGSFTVVIFSLSRNAGSISADDGYLLLAVLVTALGYAEGGRLAKLYGGSQIISWCLTMIFPLLIVPTIVFFKGSYLGAPKEAWWALAYTGAFSVFLGFFFWYKGLALSGIGKVGQVQLLQPFFTMVFSAFYTGEHVDHVMLAVAVVVALSIFVGRFKPRNNEGVRAP